MHRACAAVLVVTGVVLRVISARLPRGFLDADEAIVGLMARGWRRGEVSTFFWGQAYGGSLESVLVSGTALVTGWGVLPLRLTSIALNAAAAAVAWRLGRLVLRPGPALVGAALVWCGAGTSVWWSVKSRGFYQVTLLLGLAVALVAARCGRDGFTPGRVAAVGLLAGLGWWQSAHILYVAAPLALWLAVVSAADGARALGRRALVAGAGFVVGASPWLVFNLRNDWLSLRAGEQVSDDIGFVAGVAKTVRVGLASLFGLALGDPTRWVHGRTLDIALTVALSGLVVAGIVRLRPRTLRSPTMAVVAPLVAYPVILALLPTAGYVGEGRYYTFALPFVALALAALLERPAAAVAAAAVAVVLASSYVAWLDPITVTSSGTRLPADETPVLDELRALGDPPVLADYWLAYRLRYQSDERLAVASTTFVRDEAAQGEVYGSSAPAAWVFPAGDPVGERLRCALERDGLSAERREAGGYVIVLPERFVAPADLPAERPGAAGGCAP